MTKPQTKPCKSCGAAMYWTTTANERPMPVDAKPDPKGGFVLTLKSDGTLHADVAMPDTPSSRNRYVSHFATCVHADQHRRSR